MLITFKSNKSNNEMYLMIQKEELLSMINFSKLKWFFSRSKTKLKAIKDNNLNMNIPFDCVCSVVCGCGTQPCDCYKTLQDFYPVDISYKE